MAPELTLGLTLVALLFEAAFGYPAFLLPRLGHPVMWAGWLIGFLDRSLNLDGDPPGDRRFAGLVSLVVVLLISIGAGLAAQKALLLLPLGFVIVALLGSTLLAQRSLHDHVAEVADGLDAGLAEGRAAVSLIVGRDPEALDEAGVSRAAIESLAENFSDGIVAPALWMAIGGLPGICMYKAANTADSMIGHRTERFIDFGRAAARFDDLINLPASRLAGGLLIVAALLMPGASARGAWAAVRRDARFHKSPNAGWPEAALAGALGLALAGPRVYHGQLVTDGFMGTGGRRDCAAVDIRRALRLYRIADALLIALVGVGAAAFWAV
ncbi:adenosylcobinamide-phosphate synthase CbiB [Ancylobacter defluvii]|uniref:Cobalamin biosynthesis protein CobD n=1 Tax=Ancylobacter defluvii TaxID=1282440 RepID=A0A9W6K2G7_9HYPH|nr:adenosylcobinamide-phosphate synthase CbiB [Ancylobacter defluvii]MBS7588384.1 cobalamin biosynthesis protein CobD [Ancylobacter defluvii]GLK86789.1 cobalamin biosynthesis protein CobD [Ancylobacter defluvii]